MLDDNNISSDNDLEEEEGSYPFVEDTFSIF